MGNICKNIQKKSHGGFNVLPDEIILEIFTYLSIKDLAKCAKVSKRFRSISYSESLWCKINACMKIIPVRFLSHILSNGCQYLNLQWALIDGPQGNLPYLNYLTGPNFNSENAIDSSFNVTKVCETKDFQLTRYAYFHIKENETPEPCLVILISVIIFRCTVWSYKMF